jgi:hypothetical protein
MVMSSAPRMRDSSRVPRRYISSRSNFVQSFLVLHDTLVHRKAVVSCISKRPLLDTYNSFATTLWKTSLFSDVSASLSSSMSKRSLFAGVAADLVMSSPKATMASFRYFLHIDAGGPVFIEMDFHSQEHLPSRDGHFSKPLLDLPDDLVINLRIDMRNFVVIDIPSDGALFSADFLVCDAWVIII